MAYTDLTKEEQQEMRELEARSVYSGRISMAVRYFSSEADADRYGELVRKTGATYNGGWFHGSPLGRDRGYDHTPANGEHAGVPQYGVTC